MYKNESLKALSESGYFDNAIETAHYDLDVVPYNAISDEVRSSTEVFHEDITEVR